MKTEHSYHPFRGAARYFALAALCCLFSATAFADDDDFEVVGQKGASTVKTRKADSDGDEFEVTAKKPASKKKIAPARETVSDDPNFEIVRAKTKTEQLKDDQANAEAEYARRQRQYDEKREVVDRFLFFEYRPAANTINGVDARAFITLWVVSIIAVVAMFVILVRELGRRPPVYSAEQMIQLRSQGAATVPEQDAECLVMNLWHNMTGGKEPEGDEPVTVDSRGELNILTEETLLAAGTIPSSPDAVDKLNRLADSVCFWRHRYLIAPGISMDSGVVKRVIMAIVYVVLLYIYRGHPMYLLVVFSPVAFLTPAYLALERENSLVYRMLGGSLKLFGSMTGNALEGAGRMEGATVTVYKDGYGSAYVEKNYWGVLIVFGIKIAFALFFLYLVFIAAPFIVLYAVIRNYILAK